MIPNLRKFLLPLLLAALFLPMLAFGKDEGTVLRTLQRGAYCLAMVPGNTTQLVLERTLAQGWAPVTASHLSGTAKKARFIFMRKPSLLGRSSYRMVAYKDKKFPATLTKGKRVFNTGLSPIYSGGNILLGDDRYVVTGNSVNNTATPPNASNNPPATAQETDIWKLAGNRLLFFNQYRGLQVLDVTHPEAPIKTGTLRIVASGEQFYTLDAAGDRVVLVSSAYTATNTQTTKIHLININQGVPELVNTVTMAGSYSDSRLVGSKLTVVCNEYNYPVSTGGAAIWIGGYSSRIKVHQVDVADFLHPVSAESLDFVGSQATLQFSSGKLLLATQDYSTLNNENSKIRVISTDTGALVVENTLTGSGYVRDKFKLSIVGNHLVTITQDATGLGQKTFVRSYSLANSTLVESGNLELVGARNEQLYATRFDADKLYVVTFRRVDPLFVVNLADVAAPKLDGVLEIPGWSTYIQPLGDRLLSVGVEGRRVAVSWFNVADAANPTLLSRVWLGKPEDYTWSEANYDEKAVEYNATAQTVTLPYQSWGGSGYTAAMQEVKIVGDALELGSSINSKTWARRGDVVGDYLVSISGKEYSAVPRAAADKPPVTVVSLAWGVDYVLRKNGYLIQMSGKAWNTASQDTWLRISKDDTPDDLIEEIQLGTGQLLGIANKGDTLYVAQMVFAQGAMIKHRLRTWKVNIADYAKIPAPTSIEVDVDKYAGSAEGLWVKDDTLVWFLRGANYGYGYGYFYSMRYWGWSGEPSPWMLPVKISGNTMAYGTPISQIGEGWNYEVSEPFTAEGFVFYSTRQQNYSFGHVYALGTLSLKDAVTIGTSSATTQVAKSTTNTSGNAQTITLNAYGAYMLHVVDFRSLTPIKRDPIDLPGPLLGVTDVSNQGAILFTKAVYEGKFQASAYDSTDVWLLDEKTIPEAAGRASVAVADTIYYVKGGTTDVVAGLKYDSVTGKFAALPELPVSSGTSALEESNGYLFARGSNRIQVAKIQANRTLTDKGYLDLPWSLSYNLGRAFADESGLWLPVGDYGVEVLTWQSLGL